MSKKIKIKPEWFFSPFNHVQYALIRNLKDAKKLGLKKSMICLGDGANASTVFMEDGGLNAAVVYFPMQKLSKAEEFSIVAHEATHVWQEICAVMGEDNPSAEFEAYSIGSICFDLMLEMEKYDGME